jgi:small subunit ribosomal protein S16
MITERGFPHHPFQESEEVHTELSAAAVFRTLVTCRNCCSGCEKKEKLNMLKIRLKRLGAKKAPAYRIIVINSTTKREGKPIQELGHYNPKTKIMKLDVETAKEWVKKGAQPTETVLYLINNANADGSLNYKKPEAVKLSKKAKAKLEAEKDAKNLIALTLGKYDM